MVHTGLRARVLWVMAFALAGCLVVAAAGIVSIGRLTRVLDTLAVASDRVEILQRMDRLTSDVAASEKQMLLELDKPKIRALAEKLEQADAELQRLLAQYRADAGAAERDALDAMKASLDQWRPVDRKITELSLIYDNDAARVMHLNASMPKLSDFDGRLQALVRSGLEMKAAVGGDARSAQALGRTSIAILAVATAAAVLLSLAVGLFTARALARNLGGVIADLGAAAQQALHASQQVNSSSQSLAQGSSEQAASLEQTSATLQEIESMTRQTREHMARMESLVGQAGDSAGKGSEAMNVMVQRINLIKESSDKTAKILRTIDEIAFQTNLLALNAAVEAARAGDAGRGFAVVAEEVRNLALRSARAAQDTGALIDESRERAVQGVAASVEAQRLLQDIRGAVDGVSGVARDVTSAGREQSEGIGQIARALTQLDQLTQSNAASAEQNAAASEELSSQSEGLTTVVRRLEGLVRGGARRAASGPAQPAAARPAGPVRRLPPAPAPGRQQAAAPGRQHAATPPRVPAPRSESRATRPAPKPAATAAATLRERILRDQRPGDTPAAGDPAAGIQFRDIPS